MGRHRPDNWRRSARGSCCLARASMRAGRRGRCHGAPASVLPSATRRFPPFLPPAKHSRPEPPDSSPRRASSSGAGSPRADSAGGRRRPASSRILDARPGCSAANRGPPRSTKRCRDSRRRPRTREIPRWIRAAFRRGRRAGRPYHCRTRYPSRRCGRRSACRAGRVPPGPAAIRWWPPGRSRGKSPRDAARPPRVRRHAVTHRAASAA